MIRVLKPIYSRKVHDVSPTTLPFDALLSDEPVALDSTQLYLHLQALPDRRARRGVRYPLPMLLLIALLAKLSGQHQVRAMPEWARLRADEVSPALSPSAPHDAASNHVAPGVRHCCGCGCAPRASAPDTFIPPLRDPCPCQYSASAGW